jgi:hypothetical protein
MLLECCKFGKVRTVQLLKLPAAFLAAAFENMRCTTPASALSMSAAGALAVTFSTLNSAKECAAAMNGRKFDGRQLLTYVLPPVDAVEQLAGPSNNARTGIVPVLPPPVPPPRPPVAKPMSVVGSVPNAVDTAGANSAPNGEQAVDIEGISNNVDDFLNSLL